MIFTLESIKTNKTVREDNDRQDALDNPAPPVVGDHTYASPCQDREFEIDPTLSPK